MGKFDRNETALIQKEIRNQVQLPKIGKVEEVFGHGAAEDDSNFEANVTVDGETEPECPILNPGNGAIDIPEAGDKVLLIYTDEKQNKPFVTDTVWTNKDRPPVGRAGMYRRKFRINDSEDPSPSGPGDIYFNGYTEYDKNPNAYDKTEIVPEKSVLQIAKHAEGDNFTPTDQESIPAKIELYDAPIEDKSHVTISLNYVDNEASDATWGIKFDLKTGEFKIVDPKGFGIISDGEGNFTWHHKSINFNDVLLGNGPLSL